MSDGRMLPSGVLLPQQLRVVASNLDHPEAVCWSSEERVAYAGGEAGQLYCFRLDDHPAEVIVQVPGASFLGLALDGVGNVYGCDMATGALYKLRPGRQPEVICPPGTFTLPNYPVFDEEGSLWVSDSGRWEFPSGAIFKVSRTGQVDRLPIRPLNFPNGLALLNHTLYIVESGMRDPGVVSVPLNGLAQPEPVVALPGCVPDGLAFDNESGLWIACYQPNRVFRYADGKLDLVVDDWTGEYVISPTNLAFAGEHLDVLLLASLCGREVKGFQAGVRGAPLHHGSELSTPQGFQT